MEWRDESNVDRSGVAANASISSSNPLPVPFKVLSDFWRRKHSYKVGLVILSVHLFLH